MRIEEGIRRYAFDLEGTLVDLEPLHEQAWQEVARELGIVFGPKQFHQFVGAGGEAISKEVATIVGGDPRGIREAQQTIYQDMLYSHPVQPREGVPEYLEKARRIGGELLIASITPADYAEYILKTSRLKPFFHFVLTETSVTRRKPHPEIYLESAKRLHIDPRMMLVHEDSPPGVTAAKAARAFVAAFPVHKNLNFKPPPDALFLSWNNLNPAELYDRLTSSQI